MEAELLKALVNLVCCPAFSDALFETDKESHRAWTEARAAIGDEKKLIRLWDDEGHCLPQRRLVCSNGLTDPTTFEDRVWGAIPISEGYPWSRTERKEKVQRKHLN